MGDSVKVDDIDIKILKILCRDARTSFAEIAKDCNFSIPAITQRYQKMIKSRVITGTVLITKEGYRDTHSISADIKVESGYEDSVIEAIKRIRGCIACIKLIGKYDIHAGIRVKSLQEIARIKKILEKIRGTLTIDITTSVDRVYYYPENISLKSMEDFKNRHPRRKNNSRTFK